MEVLEIYKWVLKISTEKLKSKEKDCRCKINKGFPYTWILWNKNMNKESISRNWPIPHINKETVKFNDNLTLKKMNSFCGCYYHNFPGIKRRKKSHKLHPTERSYRTLNTETQFTKTVKWLLNTIKITYYLQSLLNMWHCAKHYLLLILLMNKQNKANRKLTKVIGKVFWN